MKIEIIRSKRKTLALQITRDGIVQARAPIRMKDEKIYEFIRQKEGWITKSLAKINQNLAFKNSFDFINFVYILGDKRNLNDIDLSPTAKPGSVIVYDRIYKDFAKKYLPKRAAKISNQIGLGYNELKVTKSKHYWGNYSKSGVMRLNFKLIILPPNIVDYVIIHELCHSKQLNHSAKFWALVKTFYPDFKNARAQLDRFGFVLGEN